MANELRTEVEQVKQQEDVKHALKQTSTVKPESTPKAETKDKLLLGTHLIILISLAAVYFVLQFKVFGFAARFIPLIQKLNLSVMAIVLLLAIAKVVDVYLIGRLDRPVARYNLRRVAKLVLGLVLAFVVVSILFQNWYTAVVSLGLLSLILGFALQTPITSFIGWIYILVRAPYRVGDRIKIGDATGDVIDVSYLDTTLWEFGGDYLSTDHPSGRVIKFPNSKILNSMVYNYTWPIFPYIWNEVKLNVAYESDLDFVAETMQRVAEEEVGERMMKQVRIYRELLADPGRPIRGTRAPRGALSREPKYMAGCHRAVSGSSERSRAGKDPADQKIISRTQCRAGQGAFPERRRALRSESVTTRLETGEE